VLRDDGTLSLQARLPADEGGLVLAALAAGRDALQEDVAAGLNQVRDRASRVRVSLTTYVEGNDTETPGGPAAGPQADGDAPAKTVPHHRRPGAADALGLMAQTTLAAPARCRQAERHEVVVHVDVQAVADGEADGRCALERGPALHPETARRLGCDPRDGENPPAPPEGSA
jgi:hypothetical protein